MTDLRRMLYLIGMPGAGKTVLGRALADALGVPFVDVDARVEEAAGMPIASLFAARGEEAFRDMESAALRAVAAGAPSVAATGGGIVLRPQNTALLRATGTVLWVDRSVAHILRDVRQDTRPLLQGDAAQRLAVLYAQREALYRAAAHVRLPNERDVTSALADALTLLAQGAHTEGK